ncbi:beta-lactamase regulator AmpE [Aestuariibacter sp. AA17]|uniref:Beta-lactamase regulator AmpE n=1 Tax=Fluctibacter corallii TaxID=2984329 RepID=A0ABT3A8J0_9ALTE|nr:beta-lactamase regulator AmpE [Aestuariibacter sp. AA17]MCV2884923.1 beta-lactamase regulator AmpE [Aestuariibacter sp. AA17]
MTLISLLFVLSIERVTTKTRAWQAEHYIQRYVSLFEKRLTSPPEHSQSWIVWLILCVPAILTYGLMVSLGQGFLTFVISTLILMLCIGCPALREAYKCYLQAANRGDMQACSMYEDEMGHHDDAITFGENLVWLNYQYYAAIVIWFAAFGAAGAVLYATIRGVHEYLVTIHSDYVRSSSTVKHVADWVPVRITALGFLLVGHFSRALPVWLGYLVDPSIKAKTLLAKVSKASEDIEPHDSDCTEEPCTLVKLAKRNVMFLMAVISVLTLSGWLA